MLSRKLTLDSIPHLIKGKRVLMRVDFNVPIRDGNVADTTRIAATLPTIEYCLEHGAASVVMMSHLGRPQGQRADKFSMKPVLPALEDLLKRKVRFLDDCIGADVESACASPAKGELIMLENLRFHAAEEGKAVVNGEKVKAPADEVAAFRNSLSKLGDLYVNDAFGTSHRAHSSMVGVSSETRAAGFLLKKELDYFARVLEKPERPLTVVLGGAKVADKILLIKNMLDLVDEMVIGGGMAFTFNRVLNDTSIGSSLFDEEGAKIVPEIMALAKQKGVKIHIPSDFVCATSLDAGPGDAQLRTQEQGIEDGLLGLDIGERSIRQFTDVVSKSRTLFWNGPQGVFENAAFAKGSLSVLDAVMRATAGGAVSVAGGGDTLNLIKKVEGAAGKISHVSTGGGASLELVEGKELPGIVALSDKA